MVTESGLRGRGGAGYSTGRKWSTMPLGPDAPHPKYIVCNADEMEPGSFKDRFLMERNPHLLLEGMLLAGFATESDEGYIFLRQQYDTARSPRSSRRSREARERGYLGKDVLGSGFPFDIELHVSIGRYICGEASAMLNALESQRANPRARPPHMTGAGLFSRPTVVNNVETYMAVPGIVRHGPDWWKGLSVTDEGGTKIFGVAGRVAKPGCVELPMGVPMRELIEVHAGGMLPGYALRAVSPGGASTSFVPADQIDVPLGFSTMDEVKSRLGTGTLVLLDDQTCPVGMTLNMMQFFAQESCGWCTPCREGLQWMAALLEDIEYGRGEPGDVERARRGRLVHGLRQVLLRPGAGRHAAARERAAPVPGRLRAPRRRGRLPLPAPRLRRAGAAGDDVVSGNGQPPKLVTVIIDGAEYQAEEGRNMLDVALALGFDLPFFCWHPVLGSIGACRQCAVRLYWTDREGNEKSEIAMACMTEAQEGTKMDIFDEEAIRFRAEMIELMMLSHPHDCPVCDEGGECHLQDMTVMTGHSYRRYRGRKRTFENQDLGPFVTHELNRCITCYRCTRFYNDYAGGRDFGVFGLRNQVYFGRAESGTLESEFSGNLIEVCPTGVFDDKPFSRRYARKWDLQTAPSVCPDCGLGCTTTLSARYGELRRVQGRFNRDVNKMFLCDRGRFGFEFVNAPERVRVARIAARAAARRRR